MRQSSDSFSPVYRLICAVLCGLVLLSLPGCSGCTKAPPTAEELEAQRKRREELAKKKPKPPFETPKVRSLPKDDTDTRLVVKPGHWTNTLHELKANNLDFKGDLSLASLDGRLDPIYLPRTPYSMSSSRPVVLPKGQTRIIESTQFIASLPSAAKSKTIQIESRVLARGGRERLKSIDPTTKLQPNQYFFVVLSRSPESHGHLKLRPSIMPPRENWGSMGLQGDYYVAFYSPFQEIALPTHGLAWTSTAFVLWDDVEPDLLGTAQQQALIDWLHWGGQLLINGHQTLDLLRGSFLEPYLPAASGPTVDMPPEMMAELNERWTPANPGQAAGKLRPLPIHPEKLPQVLRLELLNGAEFVPGSGNAVAERRVGRGRIAVTAFSLTDREMIDWGHFDNLLNGCLLRRPPREFRSNEADSSPSVYMAQRADSWMRGSALVNCGLRYFCRDATATLISRQEQNRQSLKREQDSTNQYRNPLATSGIGDDEIDEDKLRLAEKFEWNLNAKPSFLGGFSDNRKQGVAGWTDFSSACRAARASLAAAAGIDVPRRQFVMKMLGAYLVCLVPLNWILFRLIGRVEWAWFAAPLIALAGAFGVVRATNLDIGYVRSRTEIAVMELQPDYNRAHLTRFTALYTSLTSKYDLSFDGDDVLVLPFSTDRDLRNATLRDVSYRRDESTSLSGYTVGSATTGMVRSEAIFPTPSGVMIEGDEDAATLKNMTGVGWRSGIVLARSGGRIRMALFDEVAAGDDVEVTLENHATDAELKQHLELSAYTRQTPPQGEVTLRSLIQLATNTEGLGEGDIRLVAWTDEGLPGVAISPSSNQQVFRTLILGNLRYGQQADPQSDSNVLVQTNVDDGL